jgi:hypothetical protein
MDFENREMYLILNNHNFHDWKFELNNLCKRKGADTEEQKFAWLIKTINTSDKRIIMKHESEEIEIKKEDGTTESISGKEFPYKWSVERLRNLVAESNAKTKVEKFKKQEKEKDKIKNLKISQCSYDINLFYQIFDRNVVSAKNVGCDLPEEYLITLFAEGCSDHRDLKSRTAIVDMEDVKDYSELKIKYECLIAEKIPKTSREVSRERGQAHYNSNKPTCFNCGKLGHSVHSCRKPIIKCTFCNHYGHKDYQCEKKTHVKKNEIKKNENAKNHMNSEKKEVRFSNEKADIGKWNYSAKGLLNKNDQNYPYFYLDTCTTFSMTGYKELLSEVRPWNGSVSGGNTDGKENRITAIGILKLKIVNRYGEESTVDIPNVRFVENFNVTLIRPQQLYEEIGIMTDFYTKQLIGPDKRVIGNISEDSLSLPYIVNCIVDSKEKAKSFVSREVWHERLGHMMMMMIIYFSINARRGICPRLAI